MALFRIVFGGILLAFGRRLYWLFVAGFGFLIGMRLASSLFQNAAEWIILLIALVTGVAGALLAVTLQRFGIGLAGFLAGAYIAFSLSQSLNLEAGGWAWVIYLVGGVAGAILLTVIFEWSLILLSTIGGSLITLQALDLNPPWTFILFLGLFLAGLLIQGALLRQRRTLSLG